VQQLPFLLQKSSSVISHGALLVAAILLLAISNFPALGWGGEGHRTFALIAIERLEPAARTPIE
jgi:hypothetical protein